MCGVAGAILTTGSRQVVERMVAGLHHRGPDDRGVHVVEKRSGVCLGSTRLAIIDVSAAGHMPMKDPMTGNWITYNGEVYNFRELRAELETAGIGFESNTDTEVVLKAYRQWGRGALSRFRGMFSLAIWDERDQVLFIARDRLGLKPLYYWGNDGKFLFASEVRALLASEVVDRVLDPQGLECVLANGFMISPLTMIKDVRSLLPGHWMQVGVDGSVTAPQQYWSLQPTARGEAAISMAELREHFTEAVRLRMISDVPLGAFLSGGLDSSAVVGLMSESVDQLHTFSITFDESEYDESIHSRRVAEHFSTLHSEERLTRQMFLEWLPEAVAALDQPSFDGINTYCVSRAAKQSGLTVALSGLGADELFGGYRFFGTAPRLARIRHVPAPIRRLTQGMAHAFLSETLRGVSGGTKLVDALWDQQRESADHAGLGAYQTVNGVFPLWSREALLGRAKLGREEALIYGLPASFVRFITADGVDGDALSAISRLALRIFLGERTLRDTDAMSMAVSLEVRAPFTDHDFVEQTLRIPGRTRCAGAPNKPFQWELVKPILGPHLKRETKQGFTLPFQRWLSSDEFARELEGTFLDHALQTRIGLDPENVSKALAIHLKSPSRMPWSRVWILFVLLRYCELHGITAE